MRASRLLARVTSVLVIAAALAMAGGVAVAGKRVHPTADPSRPSRSERVLIRFRARDTPDGVYTARAQHRLGSPGCDSERTRPTPAAAEGRLVRLALRPPIVEGEPDARRWCVGTYRATVSFKQNVRCRPPLQCGDSVAIPVGSTTFTVSGED